MLLSAGVLSLSILPLNTVPVIAEETGPRTIGLAGQVPDLEKVEVQSGHVYDYTFTSAPTDWWVQSGIWEMTNRWSCSPGWSWFGGRSEEVAAIWNKRRFKGDLSAQFYFAFKMDLTGTANWMYHPSDVAVTINGDGKNLSTGYTLIVGADNNQKTVLLRNGKTVVETRDPDALLPALTDGQPAMNDLHRHWWYVRLNKVGSRIEGWLDNKLVLTYTDPKPLDEGQMALWTFDNGIMLSRVQVYYEQELQRAYTKSRVRTAATTTAMPSKAKPVKAIAAPSTTSKAVSQASSADKSRTAAR